MTARPLALLVLLLVACGSDGGASRDAVAVDAAAVDAVAVDAVAIDAMAVDASTIDAAPIVAGCDRELSTLRPISSGDLLSDNVARCEPMPRRPYPTRGCVIDLSAHRPGAPATCGAEVAAGTTQDDQPAHPIELVAPDLLPLVIELPAAPGVDPACDLLCRADGIPSDTVFAIHFTLRYPGSSPFHHIRVEPPWRVASGNEGDPTLCDNGRPTIPEVFSSCTYTFVDNFALVTDDPNAPAARAVIEADDLTSNEFTACCAYPR